MIRHKCPHPYHQAKRQRWIERYTPVIVIVVFLLCFLAGRFSVKSASECQAESLSLQMSVDELTAANKELLREQDFIENAKKIDIQALKDSRHSLTKLNDELSDVKQERAFYQRVIAPETLAKGLYVYSFKINATGKPGTYQYKLIVAQGINKKRVVKGHYSLSVLGKVAGKEKVLSLQNMLSSKQKTKGFVFKYYELLTGVLVFEEGFTPEQVVVTVAPSSKGVAKVRQQWFWREVVKPMSLETRHLHPSALN